MLRGESQGDARSAGKIEKSIAACSLDIVQFGRRSRQPGGAGAMRPVNISVITNGETEDHFRSIDRLLDTTRSFDCVVAFAKMSGFIRIKSKIESRLNEGMKARFFVGLDFFQSEPDLLDALLQLKDKFQIAVFVSNQKRARTFHPKIYRFDQENQVSLIIGSANLTDGGFSRHHEISVSLQGAGERWVSKGVPVARAYQLLQAQAVKIVGVGPNIITEILHTHDNRRFAVMNQNSVSGLRIAGYTEFPGRPNKQVIDGKLFEKFCQTADFVRTQLRLRDLSELDALLSYIYWKQQED
jgi:HKD family nuclease